MNWTARHLMGVRDPQHPRPGKENMWHVASVETVPVELDFSSSGQRNRSATAIEASGIRLINAVELIVVEGGTAQVEVCEQCGQPHCSPGGWVAFRRIGERVVWLPVWEEMERGEWEQNEYRPPSFLTTKGAPVFDSAAWEHLRAIQERLPTCSELPSINSREATRLCQLSAPGRVLGEFPTRPHLRRDLLIAVTDGDVATTASEIDAFLKENFETARPLTLTSRDAEITTIEFWLDLPGTPGWASFGQLGGRVCFLIDGGDAIISVL